MLIMPAPSTTLDSLRARYAAHRAEHPSAYLRDVAQALDVSEAELLVATRGDAVTRVATDDLPALLAAIAETGVVRTMTRNEWAVIEQDGRYDNLRFFERGMGQTVGDLDLRIFGWRWAFAYAVEDATPRGPRRSVQFFDGSGTSIHKVFLDDAGAFDAIRTRFRHADPTGALPAVEPVAVTADRPDDAIDAVALRARWDALTDTHQFHGLLRELEVGRLQALRLAGEERARLVGTDALQRALEGAAAQQEKLMIFVGNTGVVQIFIGTIRKVVSMKGWLNILDPGFNLHVRDQAITATYVVTKPTVDGPVRSLECYTADGALVVQLFGKRLEGEQTPAGWSAILDAIVASSEPAEVTA
jgi:putative hemin transport protein